jgi:L-alanine-DL-glutamate epimerase-like enolase superfamily enzyme
MKQEDLSVYQAYRDLTIRSIEAIPVLIPLTRAVKWARGSMTHNDNVIVVVTLSNGVQGIADAPARPTILGETPKSIVAIIREHLAPQLVGVNVFDMQAVRRVFDALAGNVAAKGAIDMACHDAQGKTIGVSCAQLLGGVVRPLTVNWRVRIAPEKEMLAEAEEMMASHGFRALKIKGGLDRAKDLRFLRSLRKVVGDDVEIAIDFNQGLSSQGLLEALPGLEEVNIALIEEPIPARDGPGKLLCSRATKIPISGDDSCFSPDDVLHELKLGAIRSIVVKVARNGYTQGRDILALARAFHTPIHNGSQGDQLIASAAAAHFACCYEAVHAHEFSSFLDASDHVADRDIVIEDGKLFPPDGPGIGLALDAEKLAKYRADN